jgi:hypothetical protein
MFEAIGIVAGMADSRAKSISLRVELGRNNLRLRFTRSGNQLLQLSA